MFDNIKIIGIALGLLVIFTISCKKGQLKEKDIVKTDEFGNIIGNSSTEQWNPISVSFSEDSKYLFRDLNDYIELSYKGDKSIELKYDCILPNELEIIAFPNPVSKIEDLRIKLKSSKKICLYQFGYQGLVGEFPGGGGAIGEFYLDGVSFCTNEFVIDPNGQFNFPTDDLIITFTVVTEDGCVYNASGNILVE